MAAVAHNDIENRLQDPKTGPEVSGTANPPQASFACLAELAGQARFGVPNDGEIGRLFAFQAQRSPWQQGLPLRRGDLPPGQPQEFHQGSGRVGFCVISQIFVLHRLTSRL